MLIEKARLIEGIRQINPSARREWLETFDSTALSHYLDHLQRCIEPRGRSSTWVRRHETPAIVWGRARL